MEGPPLGPGGEDITWPDQEAPRGRKASSTRKIKPQTSNLKLLQNHKAGADVADKVDFPTFCHELIILRGYNIGQICTWQPVQNSAPIWRRLVEKPLKTVLIYQNDYQWPENRKVEFFFSVRSF